MTEKKYKYYIIYLYDKYENEFKYDSNIFAYTCEKQLKKEFELFRNMKMFYIKKKYLTSDQIRNLFNDCNDLMLLEYKFSNNLSFPITYEEKRNIEYIGNCICNQTLITSATINPEVFKPKVRKLLKKINYIDNYLYYIEGNKSCNLRPNFLKIFLRQYGKTIKLGG